MTLIRSHIQQSERSPMELSPESKAILSYDVPVMKRILKGHDDPVQTMLTLRLVNKGFANSLTLLSLIGSGRRFHVQDEEAAAFFFDNNLDRHFASVRFGYRVFEAGFTTLAERIVQNGQSPLFDIALENCSIWPYFERLLEKDPVSYDKICKSLKGLNLRGVQSTVTSLYNLLAKTKNLEELDLSNQTFNNSPSRRGRIPGDLGPILGDNGLQQMFFNLKKINLSGMSIMIQDLVGILIAIGNLEELTIKSFDSSGPTHENN